MSCGAIYSALQLVIAIVDIDVTKNIDGRNGEAQVQAAVKSVAQDVQHPRVHQAATSVIARSTLKQSAKVPASHEREHEGATTGPKRPICPNS
jgi:hypothetical protein